jgi:hypothetical protein
MMQRRSLLRGLAGLIAAPAIVRFETIMPVRSPYDIDWELWRPRGIDVNIIHPGYGYSPGDVIRAFIPRLHA